MLARKRNSNGNSHLSNNKPYMENIKQWSGVLVAIAAIVVFGFFQKPAQVTVNIPEQTLNTPPLGALTGPDIPYTYFSFGGVRKFAGTQTLNQSSTTICSFKSPAATSTLINASVKITTSSSTGLNWEIAKSDVSNTATTTSFGVFQLASLQQASFVASTSPLKNEINPPIVFAPNSNLNVKYGGAVGSQNVFVGVCNATWEQL